MEALVEGTFARLLPGRLHPRDVAVQLARALEDSATGGATANRYAVRLSPADAQALLGDQPRLAETLAAELVAAAREAHLTLAHQPEVLILPDPDIKPRSISVTTESVSSTDTLATPVTAPLRAEQAAPPPNAFLILEGDRTVSLHQPIVSLGRRLDNHVILDDPRVSRAHAQIRLRFGRYVLYDLGSTGGTSVNGQRVQECILRPGDVISLAGVSVIYGEDEAAPRPPAGADDLPGPMADSPGTRPPDKDTLT